MTKTLQQRPHFMPQYEIPFADGMTMIWSRFTTDAVPVSPVGKDPGVGALPGLH